MNLNEVIFETVDPPIYDRKLKSKNNIILAIFFTVLFFGGIILSQYSEIFMCIGFLLFVIFSLIAQQSDKNTMLHVVKNGTLKIDSSGIYISQDTEKFFPFKNIRFITYYFDRPISVTSEHPSARTYNLKIRLSDNSILEYFIERYPIKTYKNTYRNFDEVMDRICKSSKYFAGRIRYRE